MKVTFERNLTPDLSSTLKEIIDFIEGRASSVDLSAIQSAAYELARAERNCEEIKVPA